MISKKMENIGSNVSSIRKLFEYGRKKALEIGNENVFDFSIGNPSTPAPQEVNDAIIEIIQNEDMINVNSYTSAAGDKDVRNTIAASLNKRFGTQYKGDHLFMCSGAAPALVACFRALIVNENSEIIAIAPYFPEYKVFVEGNGGKLIILPPDIPNFQINFDALIDNINENTQAIIVNSPNNPSGVVYSEDTIKRLVGVLKEKSEELGHPIYLLSDEPYRELVYGDTLVPWIPDFYDNTIVCYSYSKSLSLPGQRIGWILVPEGIMEREDVWAAIIGGARVCGHVCASSLYQRVIAKCIDIRPNLTIYQRNRDLLYTKLSEMGYRCAKPEGAFYLFLQAPDGDAAAFSERAKELGLLITPGGEMGCPSYLRISYCVQTEQIECALPLFKKLFSK